MRQLSDLLGKIGRLEVRCSRCARYGRVRLTTLIAQHGDCSLHDLRSRLATGCPKANAPIIERCSVYFPQLVELDRPVNGTP